MRNLGLQGYVDALQAKISEAGISSVDDKTVIPGIEPIMEDIYQTVVTLSNVNQDVHAWWHKTSDLRDPQAPLEGPSNAIHQAVMVSAAVLPVACDILVPHLFLVLLQEHVLISDEQLRDLLWVTAILVARLTSLNSMVKAGTSPADAARQLFMRQGEAEEVPFAAQGSITPYQGCFAPGQLGCCRDQAVVSCTCRAWQTRAD